MNNTPSSSEEPKDQATSTNFKGFTNKKCEFFPCHPNIDPDDFNCLFCYCPLAFLKCPGPFKSFYDEKNKVWRKDCSTCTLPHKGIFKSWNFIQHWLKKPKIW